jgi:hypothetical protein
MDIARTQSWEQVKKMGSVVIEVKGRAWQIDIAECPTVFGRMRYMRCPRCGARSRALHVTGDGPVCARCLGHRQVEPGSAWGRSVVRIARQAAKVEARLARCGPSREGRRRLRRRRARLLRQLEHALGARQKRLATMLTGITGAAQ